jgi:hypothetical protein
MRAVDVALAHDRFIRMPTVFDESSLARLLNVVEEISR